jgi:hypothetical protein
VVGSKGGHHQGLFLYRRLCLRYRFCVLSRRADH